MNTKYWLDKDSDKCSCETLLEKMMCDCECWRVEDLFGRVIKDSLTKKQATLLKKALINIDGGQDGD